MKLGFAVKVLGDGGLPSHDSRRWQSGPRLEVSLGYLRSIFGYLDHHDIRMYRMATALVPYGSHPDLPQFHGQIDACGHQLAEVGQLARELGLRLSSHPGQYTVLNSERDEVRAAAIAELEVQAALFDAMDLPLDAVCVIHVGGAAGGETAATDRFLRGFEGLSDRARARVVLENDDRLFSLGSVHKVADRSGLRVVFDQHHHYIHNPERIGEREALTLALRTWPAGQQPKIHFSSPDLSLGERKVRHGRRVERVPVLPDLRHHADLIDPIAFTNFLDGPAKGLDFDVLLEAKGKDLALLRLRDQMRARG